MSPILTGIVLIAITAYVVNRITQRYVDKWYSGKPAHIDEVVRPQLLFEVLKYLEVQHHRIIFIRDPHNEHARRTIDLLGVQHVGQIKEDSIYQLEVLENVATKEVVLKIHFVEAVAKKPATPVVNYGISPFDDDSFTSLRGVASGDGLLDLTRESDTVPLGQVLDEIAPGSGGNISAA